MSFNIIKSNLRQACTTSRYIHKLTESGRVWSHSTYSRNTNSIIIIIINMEISLASWSLAFLFLLSWAMQPHKTFH